MTGRLSLTFDNGPTPGITERILEVLARHGLRVTFFVIGEKLRDKAAAGLLAEMAAAGHWIGNHTLIVAPLAARALCLRLRIAVAFHGDLRGGGVDALEIIGCELDRSRGDVLLEAVELGGARDRHDPRLLRQQPG